MGYGETSLKEWAERAYACAKWKGFHDDDATRSERENVAVYLLNIHGEASEAWEAFRNGKLRELCDKAEKMRAIGVKPLTYIEEELADIVIRAFDTAEAMGIDIEQAVRSKMAYNETRPHKHGGKLA